MKQRTPRGNQRHAFGQLWKLLAGRLSAPKRPARRKQPALRLEQLEVRTVPSGMPVQNVPMPVAHNDSIDTDAGNPVTIDVLANDTDAGGTIATNSVTVAA